MSPAITALAGGVGAARLLRGIVSLVPPESLTVIVNTADDDVFYGLHVSPDLDTTIYNLAGAAPEGRGWGIAADSARVLGALGRFYPETWFRLGDLDLATHLFRTQALRAGTKLDRVTRRIADAFGVRSRVLPMSNDRVRTMVTLRSGRRLSFQRYFVERGARDPVASISWRGLRAARPAPGVLQAIREADVLIVPPSNPFTSILPILGVRGIREALLRRRAPVVAVSPVAAGRAVRGPLGGMLRARGLPISPLAIAEIYDGLVDALVVDSADRRAKERLERRGLRVGLIDVRMDSLRKSRTVARMTLDLCQELRA